MSTEMKHPAFLDKNHHLATLIVQQCHARVMHGGANVTLAELQSKYWVVKGRQLVRKVLHGSVMSLISGQTLLSATSSIIPSQQITTILVHRS